MTDKEEKGAAIVKGETEDFEAMDAWDEKAIIDELAGKVMEEFIYRIDKRDQRTGQAKTVVGLTWAGTKEIQRVMASKGQIISLGLPDIREDPDKYTIMVKATNMYYKSEMYGGAVQKKADKFGNEDGYAFTKALSKAQRNAIRAHIPEAFAASLIDECLKGKNSTKVKKIEAKQKPVTMDAQAKVVDNASDGQIEMALLLANQIGGLDGHSMIVDYLKSKNKINPDELTSTEIDELLKTLKAKSEGK